MLSLLNVTRSVLLSDVIDCGSEEPQYVPCGFVWGSRPLRTSTESYSQSCWNHNVKICTGRILSARPGPARRPHGPARPARARIEFRARPVSARGMAKPGPARPGPARSGPARQKQFPWDFLKLFNLIKQSLFNGFVGYLFVADAPQGWIPTCICKKYIDQRWKNYYYNWEIRTF